jgi:hypothetical protein
MPTTFDPAYGGKPTVPDPLEAWRKAFSFNQNNLEGILKMGDKVNQFGQTASTDWLRSLMPLAHDANMQNQGDALAWFQKLGPMTKQMNAQAQDESLAWMNKMKGFGKDLNAQNQNQLMGFLSSAIPGYNQMRQKSSTNTQQLLSGAIPQDVKNRIAQSAAERGVATGMSGSGNANSALLAALGKTSLDMQQQGEQNFTNAIQRTPLASLFNVSQINPNSVNAASFGMPSSFNIQGTPMPGMMDPTKFFGNPEDILNSDWMKSVIESAPDPKAAAEEASRKALELINGLTNRSGSTGSYSQPIADRLRIGVGR